MAHQLAYVSFTIGGDSVSPEFWTAYFAVPPDIAITKGDPINDPTGQRRTLTRRTGVWGVRSEPGVKSDALEPHLRYLIARLHLPRADLPELLARSDASARFFCYWDNESGDRVPDVPDDIRELCESQGIAIDIDEYR